MVRFPSDATIAVGQRKPFDSVQMTMSSKFFLCMACLKSELLWLLVTFRIYNFWWKVFYVQSLYLCRTARFPYSLLISDRITPALWVKKKQDTKLLPITFQILTDFQNTFADRLSGKFATKFCLSIPPHLKYVAILPCKIWISENWRQSEICIVINDKSQGSIAKH